MIWLIISGAMAYNWGVGIPGNTGTYHIVVADFASAEENDIELGAQAWLAGSGRVLRGADFEWVRGSDDTNGGARCNFNNEVYMQDQSYFDAHGWSGDIARTTTCDDTDIIFNSDKTWCTNTPSGCTSGYSMRAVAAHEFGHRIGFQHEDDNIATMNHLYPNGGDIGKGWYYDINEDDYVGLCDHKSDSSTGANLGLSRWKWVPDSYDGMADDDEKAEEVWVSPDRSFDRSSDTWIGATPNDILAVNTGTTTEHPLVKWVLVTAPYCGVGSTEYQIGTVTPGLSANLPFAIGPSSWALADTVPTGDYYLCAWIDAGQTISETNEGDNSVASEWKVTVVP
jgi:hypothetical protein